ncbi:uncharacterized protein LOC133518055 [Cydia pomonella]|uniref:uncharacterized protein LOC133518055 n=1 Tax=Cydia pomonella TaxID=82600 RepID=UPI002ADD7C73|nr:uncharacterized protein LOC133518055 [Cydia pomonella]
MDTDLKARKQVSLEQLKGLLDYLNEHQDLAKGLTRGRRGKLHSVKLWNVCAKKLNAIGEGAVKDGKGWSKYWCDWKYRVRRRALELKAARDSNKPPPDGVASLSQMEETILEIIGESVVSGVVIKSDPLAEGASFSDEEESYMADNSEEAPINYGVTKSRRGKKRRHSSQNNSDADEVGTTSPYHERKKKLKTDNESDEDESASELIRLEREKLEYTKQFLETTREISSHVGTLHIWKSNHTRRKCPRFEHYK